MVQVPYQPVPSVRPTESPTPAIGVSAGPAAFGVNIGQALEGLGKTEEQVGNELWQRATAMQELRNRTTAEETYAKFAKEAAQRHAQFDALEGSNAGPKALEKLSSDITQMREKYRGGLNPMTQRYFDSDSLSLMSRTIFNAAGHSANEQKKWVNQTADANIWTAKNQALQNAWDEQGFQAGLRKIEDGIRTKQGTLGWSPQKLAEERAIEVSGLWAHRLEGMAKVDPWEAKRHFDANRDKLAGNDIFTVENYIREQVHRVVPRNISHDLTTGADLSYGAGPVSMDRAKGAISKIESGGRYDLSVDSKTPLGRALGKYQVMEGELQHQLKDSGLPSMTPEEFLKNPSAQEQLFSVQFGKLMNQYGNFNDAASVWFTGKPVKDAGGRQDRFGTTVGKYLSITNHELANSASIEDKVNLGRDRARRFDPNDTELEDRTAQRIETDHYHEKAIERENNFNNKQTVEGALIGNTPDGKIPTTVEELTADPKVAAAWDKLENSQKDHYLERLKHIQKGDTRLTDEGLKRWRELKGMAEDDPAQFLDQDIMSEKLPISTKKELMNLQLQKHKNGAADPQVTRALGWIQGDLRNAGIGKGEGLDKDAYYQFVGSLQDVMREYQTEHKKAPPVEEVQKITRRLLQDQVTGPWFWHTHTRMFQEDVPENVRQSVKDQVREEEGTEPSDDYIRRKYIQLLYKKLYSTQEPSEHPP